MVLLYILISLSPPLVITFSISLDTPLNPTTDVIFCLIQIFKHSSISIVYPPSEHRVYEIVRRDPENIRSGSADIAGIERMSIAILERRG